MAICALVFQVSADEMEGVKNSLHEMPEIVEIQQAPDYRLAVTCEASAAKLPDFLKYCQNLPGVLDLALVYLNYEDDLDEGGFIDVGSLEELRSIISGKA